MIKTIKNNYHYILVFIYIFFTLTLFGFNSNYGDPICNYAFSYGIVRGEIPYLDFNTISTPLYSFIMSIGLFIWNNYLMFLIEQTILITIMFILLNKTYGKKSYLLLLASTILLNNPYNETYNFMVILCLVILLFLEKKYSSKDYLIGIFIGLAILSKHTVGVFFIIPSIIYYRKDICKLLRRLKGLLTVGIIFIIYLLITKSFYSFLDLCVFGLFDFGSNNSHPFSICFILTILVFIISLFITIKNRKDISNYYLLFTVALAIPMFDFHHFSLYVFCFIIQLLPLIKKYDNYMGFVGFLFSIIISVMFFMMKFNSLGIVFSKDIKRFEYLLNGKDNYELYIKSFEYFDKYDDPLVLSYLKTFYDISNDKDIDYFDVFMYGNAGYDGNNKMIKRLNEMHNRYIIIDLYCYNEESSYSQFNKVAAKYVIDNYEFVDNNGDYAVYYKK